MSRGKWILLIHAAVMLTVMVCLLTGCGEGEQTPVIPATVAQEPVTGWVQASGNLWAGANLYFGEEPARRRYVAEVLGGNENYTDPLTGKTFRGLKVRYPDGHTEWKARNAVISGPWHIKADDPALAAQRWENFTF